MEEMVSLTRASYDDLTRSLIDADRRNHELKRAVTELQDKKKPRVIVHEIIEDAEGGVTEYIDLFEFEDVRKKVEEYIKENIKELKAQIEDLEEAVENKEKNYNDMYVRALKAEVEVSRLKSRSLWQRILNK